MPESVDHEKLLGELLAVMHRDGGQYIQRHGYAKATRDAMQVRHRLIAERDEARREVARLRRMISDDRGSTDGEA